MTPLECLRQEAIRLGRCGLSSKELSRVEVMGRVKAGSLRLQEAAELLGLSYRQAKRVWARYRGGGAKALQHGNCGRISNRAHPEEFRQAVLVQVRRRYADFGPTLAAEHLEEEDGLQVFRRDPAALDESGRTLAPPASAKAVSPAQDAQAAFRRTGAVGCQLSSLAGRSRRQRMSHAHGR